jgi:tripartite-type tricarboxylate transporter receptor subunit TctC
MNERLRRTSEGPHCAGVPVRRDGLHQPVELRLPRSTIVWSIHRGGARLVTDCGPSRRLMADMEELLMARARCLRYPLAFVVACAAVLAPAYGQSYPTKPVRLVVAGAPGGGTDTVARMIAQRLSDVLGQPVVVDPRGQMAGSIGTEIVARSAPDGYTLLIAASSHAMNPALISKLPYDTLRDFAPVTQTTKQDMLLVVHPSVPARNLKELIALARASPGKLNYGAGQVANALPMELLKSMSGADIQHVPYKGGSAMLTALVSNEVQVAISGAITAIPYVKQGRLRALGIGDSKRSAILPEIPTIAEAGLPGYEAINWHGMFAPARTPGAIVERLNKDIAAILHSPEVSQRLISMGSEPVGNAPDVWGRVVEAEIAKWTKVARMAGMQPQ